MVYLCRERSKTTLITCMDSYIQPQAAVLWTQRHLSGPKGKCCDRVLTVELAQPDLHMPANGLSAPQDTVPTPAPGRR